MEYSFCNKIQFELNKNGLELTTVRCCLSLEKDYILNLARSIAFNSVLFWRKQQSIWQAKRDTDVRLKRWRSRTYEKQNGFHGIQSAGAW